MFRLVIMRYTADTLNLVIMVFIWIVVLLVSLYAVVKSADYFTEYSEKLGLALGLSSFIIGATIVAVGTSLPELVSSLFAVLDAHSTEFVVDNVVGSNIANALLILGVGAVVARPLSVKTSLIDVDLPFFFASMALFVYFAYDRVITTSEGIFLLIFFLIFLVYNIRSESKEIVREDKEELAEMKQRYAEDGDAAEHIAHTANKKTALYVKYGAIILVSMFVLAISAKYLIDSVLTISALLNIQSTLLTVTVVAFGTSLPEVLTSIAAIKRGNHAIAIGNVFGSNTFNVLLVTGVPAVFTDLQITDLTYVIAVPFLVIATFVTIFTTFDNVVRKWEGVAMLFLYIVFLARIINII